MEENKKSDFMKILEENVKIASRILNDDKEENDNKKKKEEKSYDDEEQR